MCGILDTTPHTTHAIYKPESIHSFRRYFPLELETTNIGISPIYSHVGFKWYVISSVFRKLITYPYEYTNDSGG